MLYNKAREVAASDEREVDFDLGSCLEDLVTVQDNSPTPVVQVVILDGAAIVNMFRPDFANIFLFTIQVFLPYITPQLQHVSKTSCVDEHLADSLKAEARTRRGTCIRRRVSLHWQQLYRGFSFLAASAATIATDKQVVSTYHTDVPPCTHEEADTRILLHLEDAVKQGYARYPFNWLSIYLYFDIKMTALGGVGDEI